MSGPIHLPPGGIEELDYGNVDFRRRREGYGDVLAASGRFEEQTVQFGCAIHRDLTVQPEHAPGFIRF